MSVKEEGLLDHDYRNCVFFSFIGKDTKFSVEAIRYK